MIGRLLRTASPINRYAIIAFLMRHRRSILRWGRSLWIELRRPGPIAPSRVATIGRLLWTITRDDDLAHAKQLKSVELDGDTAVVDVAPGWVGTSRLVDRIAAVEGVHRVVDRSGNPLGGSITTTARDAGPAA